MKSPTTFPLAAALVLLCFALQPSFATAEKPTHIFILSGQSNMAGMNPKLGFEPEAKALFPDAEVVYIKISQGGQPIRLWVNEWNEIASENGIDLSGEQAKYALKATKFYEPILKGYQGLLKKHPNPASVTFCWMQGERDAREKLSSAYQPALAQLIANLRRDLKQLNMNFVIGRISDFGKPDYTDWQNIRKAQVDLATKDKRGSWVDCDDLNNKVNKKGVKVDDLHYTKEGYELLGRRYARQAKALIEGKEPNKEGRPE